MGAGNKPSNGRTAPKSNLVTYKESFLYPLGKSSTHKMKITLQGLFVLLPNPPTSPQSVSISALIFPRKCPEGTR